jgi:hypothetical protein
VIDGEVNIVENFNKHKFIYNKGQAITARKSMIHENSLEQKGNHCYSKRLSDYGAWGKTDREQYGKV